MIEFNKLTFNNKSTADFDFEIIVETSPSLNYVSSKSELFELDGKTGALVRDNSNRGVLPLKYTLHLIKPTDEQLKEIKTLAISRKTCGLNHRRKTSYIKYIK